MKRTLLILTLLCSAAAADDLGEAEQLYNEGQSAFDAARYSDAISAWQRSYTLSNAPGLLFNLAQAYRLRATVDDCAVAVKYYRQFIALDPASSQRALAERFETEAATCARPVTPASAPAPVSRPMPMPMPRPLPQPSKLPMQLGLGIGAGGVALVGLGLYFGHRADALGAEVTNACATVCNWGVYGPRDAAGRSAETRQYVFAGVGIAAILSGGALYWWGTREATRLTVVPRADGAALTWSRAW